MDKDEEKKDDKEEIINSDPLKASSRLNITGYDSNSIITGRRGTLDTAARTYDLDTGATPIRKDIRAGGIFMDSADDATRVVRLGGAQRIDFATHSAMLGDSAALGDSLLGMKINTIGDARNFLVGVNNVASVFSKNSGLLNAIESASAIASNHGRLTVEAIDRINIPSVTKGIQLATAYHLDGRQMVRLSESVTTVLAYGQAVQNQFGTVVANNEILKTGLTAIRDASLTLGKPLSHIPIYTGNEAITSPFIFEPQKVKVKEVEKVLPEVKKELPEKTTEAIEMLEYFQKPDAKKGDKKIMTTLNEVKRAMETMLGFTAIFAQKTTTEIAITSIPELQVRNIGENISPARSGLPQKISLVEDLVIGPLVYRKDGAILYKQTPIILRHQLKTLCVLFMNNHKNFLDYSTIKDELVDADKRSTTSFETITKYVSELHKILKEHFKREVIFNHEKDGYIFNTE